MQNTKTGNKIKGITGKGHSSASIGLNVLELWRVESFGGFENRYPLSPTLDRL